MCMNSRFPTTPAREEAPVPCRRDGEPDRDEKSGHVRLEISADRLQGLLKMGVLCAADFRCLDCESKRCVWRLCLASCIKHLVPGPSRKGVA